MYVYLNALKQYVKITNEKPYKKMEMCPSVSLTLFKTGIYY